MPEKRLPIIFVVSSQRAVLRALTADRAGAREREAALAD